MTKVTFFSKPNYTILKKGEKSDKLPKQVKYVTKYKIDEKR